MAELRVLDELGARISEVLKNSPAQDLEKNLRALITALLERFDVVTREDFDAQKRVLERAQAQLAELEVRLAELEANPRQAAR
jgi:BMFP domain-containing protein YqiC